MQHSDAHCGMWTITSVPTTARYAVGCQGRRENGSVFIYDSWQETVAPLPMFQTLSKASCWPDGGNVGYDLSALQQLRPATGIGSPTYAPRALGGQTAPQLAQQTAPAADGFNE